MNRKVNVNYKEEYKGICRDRDKNVIQYRYQNMFIDDSNVKLGKSSIEGNFNKFKCRRDNMESRSLTPKNKRFNVYTDNGNTINDNQQPSPMKCNIIRPNDLLNISSVTTAKSLLNKVQISLGKLNDVSTKEIAFNEMQSMITTNRDRNSLRIFLGALGNYKDNCTLSAKEYQVLLYGFIARTFKDDLYDPFDKPPNILKTINRMLTLIRNNYLQETSFIIHKACAHSMMELFDYCMPKREEDSDVIISLFFDPLLALIATGRIKCIQEGAAICLSDMILSIGNRSTNNRLFQIILSKLMHKVIPQMLKGVNDDNQYVIQTLYNLMTYSSFDGFAYYLKELYQRLSFILQQKNYSYYVRINSLQVFALIAKRLLESDEYIIAYFQDNVVNVLKEACKDRIHKVQLEAKEALRLWMELKEKFNRNEVKKVYSDCKGKSNGINDAIRQEMEQYNNEKDMLIRKITEKKRSDCKENDKEPYIIIKTNSNCKEYYNNNKYTEYTPEENQKQVNSINTQLTTLKHSLSTLIIGSLSQTIHSIESDIEYKLNQLDNKIINVNNKIAKQVYTNTQNNEPIRITQKKPSPAIHSHTLSQWQLALQLIEQNNPTEAFEIILSTKDDIYLLRLLFITGPILNLLPLSTSKQILLRLNLISRSNQIQSLLINTISQASTLNILSSLPLKDQNDIIDSLYQISLNQSSQLAEAALKLYNTILSKSPNQ